MVRKVAVLLYVVTLFSTELAAQRRPVLSRVIPASDTTAALHILQRMHEWHEAIQRADTMELRRILLPEYSVTTPPFVETVHLPLQQYINNAVNYQLHEGRLEASDVRVLGEVAVVTSRFWQ